MTSLDRLEALEKELLAATTLQRHIRTSVAYQQAVTEAAPALIAVARAAEDVRRAGWFCIRSEGEAKELIDALARLNAEAPKKWSEVSQYDKGYPEAPDA